MNKKKTRDEIISLLERCRLTDKSRIEILLSIIKIYEDYKRQKDINKHYELWINAYI